VPKLNLDGTRYANLTAAIQDALPGPPDLEQMLKFKLNKRLVTFAPTGAAYPYIVFKVVEYAQAQGWTAELLNALRATVPDNAAVFAFSQDADLSALSRQFERKITDASPFFDLVPLRTSLATLEAQICRIEIPIPGLARPLYGTGFLLGPGVVMTNYHVMQPVIEGTVGPGVVTCLFDYKQLDHAVVNAGVPYTLPAANWLIDFSKPSAVDELIDPGAQVPAPGELDYAVIRLGDTPGSAPIGTAVPGISVVSQPRGWITPPAIAPVPQAGEPLFVFQHPDSRPMQVAFEMDGVLGSFAGGMRLRHKVNTEAGSSGAPCFNKSFELVALHHSGDPNFFHRATYNEAIPFGKIVALVADRQKTKDVFGPWN
jgi:hypothetical protein